MASTSSTIGGSSSADEMFTAAVNQLISQGMWKAADTETVRPLLRRLNEGHAKLLINALPVMVAGLTARLPMALVGNSPMIASIVKDIIMDGTNSFVEVVKHGVNISDEEAADMFKNAAGAVVTRKVLIDPLRHFHRPECASLQLIKPPQPVRQEKKDKQGNVIPQPPLPSPFPEITLEQALQQKLQPSPCCHASFQTTAAVTKPVKPRKFSSFMELAGSLPDADRERVLRWHVGLAPNHRVFADTRLPTINNPDEIAAFLTAIKQDPDYAIDLLQSSLFDGRRVTDPVERYVASAGAAIEREAIAFDKSLAPKVAKLEADREARKQAKAQTPPAPPVPKKPEPWWKMFFPF